MNIALGTLFLFLLVVPGIAYRYTLYFGPRTKKRTRLSAFDDFISAIIPGLTAQLIGALLVGFAHYLGWTKYYIDFLSLGQLMFGTGDKVANEFSEIKANLGVIFAYNTSLIFLSALIGYGVRRIIHELHFDHRYSFLRFNNEWYYILKGETVFFYPTEGFKRQGDSSLSWWARKKIRKSRRADAIKQIKAERKKYNLCFAYIVTKEIDKERYVFKGLVKSFHLMPDGQIDTIWLSKPSKCILGQEDLDENWIPITVNVLAIKGCEIIDIGIRHAPMSIEVEDTDPNPKLVSASPVLPYGSEALPRKRNSPPLKNREHLPPYSTSNESVLNQFFP